MANLFEINRDIMAAWDAAVDPETGEIDENALAIFDKLSMERDEKIENIACWIKNLKSDADALKAESAAMKERAEAAERKAESLKGYLSAALHGQKFQTPKVAIGWRHSVSVAIQDEAVLPEKFVRVKTTTEPMKLEIKRALQQGEIVEGCELVEKDNIQIR